MDTKKVVDKFAFASVGIHFCVCGIPLLLTLFGFTTTLFNIPHNLMTAILTITGLLLITSVVMRIKCCNHNKTHIVSLVICFALYTVGLLGHFGVFKIAENHIFQTQTSCH